MERHVPFEAPQEIIDEIVDLCSEDKKTLKACSLTSRAWVYRTRKHLFWKIILTDKSLPTWREIVLDPKPSTDSESQPQRPPASSSSYTSSWISSCVISLQLVPKYYARRSNNFGPIQFFQAKSHLHAFTSLKTLDLAAISFTNLQDRGVSLVECFGPLADTVRELKLSFCTLDEGSLFAFLRLFSNLDSLELHGNRWYSSIPAVFWQKDPPSLRGSLTVSEITHANVDLLETLVIASVQYHTIIIGYNETSTIREFNVLFESCKDHLERLILTAPEAVSSYPCQSIPFRTRTRSGLRTFPAVYKENLDPSPCKKLVEVRGRFHHARFKMFISVLNNITSPRFRKLTIFITPPIPAVDPKEWGELETAVVALATRVGATAGSDVLEVLISSYHTVLGGTKLCEIEGALPLIASNSRVSLRTEYVPIPRDR